MARLTVTQRLDRVQRNNKAVAVVIATAKKFQEDSSTRLAAMVAFWAFFSIFPLFLLAVSLLGYLLPASTKTDVLQHVASMFPLLDPSTVGHLSGTAWTIVLGAVTALWGGTAVMRSAQFALNNVWEVPMRDRSKLKGQLVRAVEALASIGVGLVASVLVSGFVTGSDHGVSLGIGGHIAGYALAAVLDIGLFLLAFVLLTDRRVTWRQVLPGAVLSGGAFWILEQLSSFIISRHLHSTQSTYGHFATVITILWWFYLQAVITLLGAQLNVVLDRRLYPRALGGGRPTDGDRRALVSYPASQLYHEGEQVDTRLAEPHQSS